MKKIFAVTLATIFSVVSTNSFADGGHYKDGHHKHKHSKYHHHGHSSTHTYTHTTKTVPASPSEVKVVVDASSLRTDDHDGVAVATLVVSSVVLALLLGGVIYLAATADDDKDLQEQVNKINASLEKSKSVNVQQNVTVTTSKEKSVSVAKDAKDAIPVSRKLTLTGKKTVSKKSTGVWCPEGMQCVDPSK